MSLIKLIEKVLTDATSPVTIVTLGPLTNLPEAFAGNPEIRSKVKMIYVMGGALRVKGNVIVPTFTDHLKNKDAEWNLYVDPLAARRV